MFAEKLKSLMKEKKITSGYQLAKELQVSQSMVDNWVSGKTKPTFEGIRLLCAYFNVSADYLLGFSDAPMPPVQTMDVISKDDLERTFEEDSDRGILLGFHDGKQETIPLAPKEFSKMKAFIEMLKD